MINTIIFDLGGVVLNRGIWLFREYLMEHYNLTEEETVNVFIKKYYKPYFSGIISEEEFWKNSIIDLGISADWKELRKILLNLFRPNEGMFELIKMLKNKGYKTVLLSDQSKEWWPILNKKYAIDSYFDCCIISAEVGFHKPDERIYKLALEKSSSLPEKSIFVDDLQHNLEPAKRLGFKTILYLDTKQLIGELSHYLDQQGHLL